MAAFDIGQTQSAASLVAGSLVPKHTTARPHAASSGSAKSDTSSTNTTVTSNDFLTLLVSELKNQDPSQPTDPNAYITQLVGVDSLQQLIQINQGIGTLHAPTTSNTTNS